jgi:hypothetical protein
MLRGSYFEADQHGRLHRRRAGHIALRRAEHRHRIILADHPSYGAGAHRPATTLIITGPHRRQWGFWCEGQRFVPWREFGAGGCGEDNPGPVMTAALGRVLHLNDTQPMSA